MGCNGVNISLVFEREKAGDSILAEAAVASMRLEHGYHLSLKTPVASTSTSLVAYAMQHAYQSNVVSILSRARHPKQGKPAPHQKR